MKHGYDQEGFLIRSIGNKKISHRLKSDRSGGQVSATVTLLRKRNEAANRSIDLLQNTICRRQIVSRDEFPDFFQISECFRVEDKAAHERRRSSLLLRMRLNASSPSSAFTRPLLLSS